MINVIQVGPAPARVGGMATVIAEYVAMSDHEVRGSAAPTWTPNRPVWSLVQSVRLAFRILAGIDRPDVVHIHFSERGSFVREGLLAFVSSARSIPAICTLHGADFPEFATRHPKLVRAVLRRCVRVHCLGPAQAKVVHDICPPARTELMMNPVRVEQVRRMPVIGRVVFAGELSRRKGFDRLLSAWPSIADHHPGVELVVCGPMADVPIKGAPPSVSWRGTLSREDVLDVLSTAHVTCLPSRREVLPMTLLESLGTGTPVVATSVGEIAQLRSCPGVRLITNDETDAVEALEQELTRALSTTPSIEHSASTVAWISKRASIQAVKASLWNSYREALKSDPEETQQRS